ncbi:hypothetical protein PUN28_013805 [Cardiocondyla obscurior]|uniref:Carbohydrate kinase PfkB domain-containing protein n=1 Tax=Cardiocondyla obscurior TaxID=286306 RepID=A0AAW2F8B6_9HYME
MFANLSFHEEVIGETSSTEIRALKILCVGRVCLDIVQTCTQFPAEDSTERWQRGGNASNTCTALSLIGQPCELLACLSADDHITFMRDDLRKYKIDYSHCPVIKGTGCLIASIILSLSTGSRTIVYHNQGLPKSTLKSFMELNLDEYCWIHFEGINIDEVLLCIQRIEKYNNSILNRTPDRMPITISLELESPRSGSRLLSLLPHVDVAFVSKEFANNLGLSNMNEVVEVHNVGQNTKATIVCAWGEKGAIARTSCGVIVQSPAFPPKKVIDTLGAGDTFNAAIIYYLNKSKVEFMHKYNRTACTSDTSQTTDTSAVKQSVEKNFNRENFKSNQLNFITEAVLQKTVKFACCVAGAKVGLRGFDNLDVVSKEILQMDFVKH